MNNRYIKRFSMPSRQYIQGSPVILAAGALLEDTKNPRLVAQLKWKNISPSPIKKFVIVVHALDAAGETQASVKYAYIAKAISRGATFGQYQAIELPMSDAVSIKVEIVGTVYANGEVWKNENTEWATLPAFEKLDINEEETAYLKKVLPRGKYGYKEECDLWYCTCGAVNNAEEKSCYRCKAKRDLVMNYAAADVLSTIIQEKKDAEEKRAADIEKFKADAGNKLADLKAAAEQKAAELAELAEQKKAEIEAAAAAKAAAKQEAEAEIVAPVEDAVAPIIEAVPETPAAEAVPEETPVVPADKVESALAEEPAKKAKKQKPAKAEKPAGEKKSKKGLIIAIVAVLVVAVLAVIFVPQFTGGEGLFGPAQQQVEMNVTTPTDGEPFDAVFYEDEEGAIFIDLSEIQKYFPEATSFAADRTPAIGDDIDQYIKKSYNFMNLVGSNLEFGGNEGMIRFATDKTDPVYIFAFKDDTILCGHTVGYFEKLGDGAWSIKMTPSNYDVSNLARTVAADFYEAIKPIPVIEADDVMEKGAEYFIPAYTFQTGREEFNNIQKYYLWRIYNNEDLENYNLIDMKYWDDYAPKQEGSDAVWSWYMVFNESKELLGFTMRTTYQGATSFDVSTPGDIGKHTLTLEIVDNCLAADLNEIRKIIPEATSLEFTNVPNMRGDFYDFFRISYHMGTYIGSGGQDYAGSQYGMVGLYNNAYALYVFSDKNTLCGYAIGMPDVNAKGTFDIELTSCKVDLSEYYAIAESEFASGMLFESYVYMESDMLKVMVESGEAGKAMAEEMGIAMPSGNPVYFMTCDMWGRPDDEMYVKQSEYNLWAKIESGNVEFYAMYLDYIDSYEVQDGYGMYVLILDENFNPVAYSLYQ